MKTAWLFGWLVLAACSGKSPPVNVDSAEDWGEADVDAGPIQVCADPVAGLTGFVDSAERRGIDVVIEGDPNPSTCNYIPGGVVAHDMDLDGDIDLMFARVDEFPYTFVNDGTGMFSRVDISLGSMSEGRGFYGLAVADVDGDRLPEVFRTGDGFIVMAKNEGGMSFGPPLFLA